MKPAPIIATRIGFPCSSRARSARSTMIIRLSSRKKFEWADCLPTCLVERSGAHASSRWLGPSRKAPDGRATLARSRRVTSILDLSPRSPWGEVARRFPNADHHTAALLLHPARKTLRPGSWFPYDRAEPGIHEQNVRERTELCNCLRLAQRRHARGM